MMTFGPTSEEREFQDAIRTFFSKEHGIQAVRQHYGRAGEACAGVLDSCREFGIFEWVQVGGIRAVALLAREVGRSLLPAPLVSDVFWGVLVASILPISPWEVGSVLEGKIRVAGMTDEIRVGGFVEGVVGAQLVVRACLDADELLVFQPAEETFELAPIIDGSMVVGRLSAELLQQSSRVTLPVGSARLVGAWWQICHAAQLIGAAERCVELFQAHGKTRHQFGAPIAGFQAVQQQAAAHFAQLSAASALCSFAEWCAVHDRSQLEHAATSALVYAARICRPLAEVMVQIHGGIGFTWEYDLHLYLRRIMAIEFLYGRATLETVSEMLRSDDGACCI